MNPDPFKLALYRSALYLLTLSAFLLAQRCYEVPDPPPLPQPPPFGEVAASHVHWPANAADN